MTRDSLPAPRPAAGGERKTAAKPADGAVRLCILAAYCSDDPASTGLLIAAAYAPPPEIRPAGTIDCHI
jgi:hypothetical protein